MRGFRAEEDSDADYRARGKIVMSGLACGAPAVKVVGPPRRTA